MAEPVDLPFGLWTPVHKFNRIRQMAPMCPQHSAMSCTKMAEQIDLPFVLWTQVGQWKHKFNPICRVALMCPHGKAHWRHLPNTT